LCWGGLPYVVIAAAFVARDELSSTARLALTHLSAAATVLLVVIAVLLLKKLRAEVTKRDLQKLNGGLTTAWAVLTVAGLIAALFAPMPD
jgi:FtsH-binding integral membrane protein